MSTTNIDLRPIHWDILKLVRILCYEGLPQTKWALVDPNDRRLPLWGPNPYNTRFVLPNGVPKPLVRACLLAVPFAESERRWGKDGNGPDPALQYLIDRKLLDVSEGNRPIVAAFRNYFNDSEVLSTVRFEENETGRFYVWESPSSTSVLHEQNGSLVTRTPYPVFKLSEPAHELLDAEKAAEPAKSAVGTRVGEPETETPTEVDVPNRARKAGEQYRQAAEALGVSDPTDWEAYNQLGAAMGLSGEEADLPRLDTWQRNLREYRRLTGQQKNKPRAGREGSAGSLVRADLIEPKHLPTRIRPKSSDQ